MRNYRYSKGWFMNNTVLIAGLLPALMFADGVKAEEYLIRGDAKFLGWRVSDQEFETCDKTQMPIRDGRIVIAREKCGGVPPPAIAELPGIVVAVKVDKNILTIIFDAKALKKLNPKQREERLGLNGTSAEFYVPASAIRMMQDNGQLEAVGFRQIKKGDKVVVKPATRGRAESVTVEPQSGSVRSLKEPTTRVDR